MTPACAPISEPRPIRRCPAIAACPPTRTKSSSTVEPEIPTCATTMQQRPRVTLWPICTRLSRREPAPITVSRDDPRSIVELAPTSTSSSRITRPSWGIERNPPGGGKSEPFLPNPRTRMNVDARSQNRETKAHMCANPAVPTDGDAASDDCTRTDPTARSYLRSAFDNRQGPNFCRRINLSAIRYYCRRVNTRTRRWHRVEQGSNAGPSRIRFARLDRHSCRWYS